MDAESPVKRAKASADVQRLIRQLRKLEKSWPPGLWLFATGTSINLMATHEDGTRHSHTDETDAENGMDPSLLVESFEIPNDGGDW